MLIKPLAFDAFRPDFVPGLDMNENPRVISMWRHLHKPPDAGELVIMIHLRRSRVAIGLSRALDYAIADTPGLCGVGIVPHAERPAVEILAIEKFDGRGLMPRRFATGD